MILPAVLYECNIWPLRLREERGLRVAVKRALGRALNLRRRRLVEDAGNYVMRSFSRYQ
jgi:hypothetical protein